MLICFSSLNNFFATKVLTKSTYRKRCLEFKTKYGRIKEAMNSLRLNYDKLKEAMNSLRLNYDKLKIKYDKKRTAMRYA